jgi:predicted P-loop ATPase
MDSTISELIASLLVSEPCDSKAHAPAWSPIVYSAGRRLAAEAVSACALAYDLDTIETPDLEALSLRLETLGWIYVIHETYTAGRYRVVIPLASDCPAKAYAETYDAGARTLEIAPLIDTSASDLARLFYAPSRPPGEARFSHTGGEKLCDFNDLAVTHRVKADLHIDKYGMAQRVKPAPAAEKRNPAESGVTKNGGADFLPKIFDSKFLRDELATSRSSHKADIERLLDGTLRVPPGTRETLLHPVLCALAYMRAAPPEGVVEELLRRIFAVRDGHETHMEEWVGKALYSYTRAAEKKEVHDEAAAVVEKFFHDEKWREKLKYVSDSKGGIKGMVAMEGNILAVLRNDENFRGHLRWNLLRQRVEITGGVLAKEHAENHGDLGVALASWFQTSEYQCQASREMVGSVMQYVAIENGYDPVRQYLRSLPTWDGTKRLSRLLLDYAQAEGAEDWIRVITRKFFIAAIARACDPGCQVDSVLVLQGKQGGGKTSLVRVMGAGFHVETSLDLQNKDSVMTAANNWLVELGELASLRKSDVESVRNFITRKEDQIRLPYGRSVKTMPRRCVFIGTTNSKQPLTDPEGNRRFWVVSVGKVDTLGLERVRDQMWAEALYAYNAGEQWWLTQDEARRAAMEAKVYEAEDLTAQEILAWLDVQKQWPETLSARDVATKILHRMSNTITAQDMTAINRTMEQLGWESTRRRKLGIVSKCFIVPSRRAMEAAGQLDNVSDNVIVEE